MSKNTGKGSRKSELPPKPAPKTPPDKLAKQAAAHTKRRDEATAKDVDLVLTNLSGQPRAAAYRLLRRMSTMKGRLKTALAVEKVQVTLDPMLSKKFGHRLVFSADPHARIRLVEELMHGNEASFRSAERGYLQQISTLRRAEAGVTAAKELVEEELKAVKAREEALIEQLSAKENALIELRTRHARDTMGAPGSPVAPPQADTSPMPSPGMDSASGGPTTDSPVPVAESVVIPDPKLAPPPGSPTSAFADSLAVPPEMAISLDETIRLLAAERVEDQRSTYSDRVVALGVQVRRQIEGWLRELSNRQAHDVNRVRAELPKEGRVPDGIGIGDLVKALREKFTPSDEVCYHTTRYLEDYALLMEEWAGEKQRAERFEGLLASAKDAREVALRAKANLEAELHGARADRDEQYAARMRLVADCDKYAAAIDQLRRDLQEAANRYAELSELDTPGDADLNIGTLGWFIEQIREQGIQSSNEREEIAGLRQALETVRNEAEAQRARADAIYLASLGGKDGDRTLIERLLGERNTAIARAEEFQKSIEKLVADIKQGVTEHAELRENYKAADERARNATRCLDQADGAMSILREERDKAQAELKRLGSVESQAVHTDTASRNARLAAQLADTTRRMAEADARAAKYSRWVDGWRARRNGLLQMLQHALADLSYYSNLHREDEKTAPRKTEALVKLISQVINREMDMPGEVDVKKAKEGLLARMTGLETILAVLVNEMESAKYAYRHADLGFPARASAAIDTAKMLLDGSPGTAEDAGWHATFADQKIDTFNVVMGPSAWQAEMSPTPSGTPGKDNLVLKLTLDTTQVHLVAQDWAQKAIMERDFNLCIFVLARAERFDKVYPDDLKLWIGHFHERKHAGQDGSKQPAPSNESDGHLPSAPVHPGGTDPYAYKSGPCGYTGEPDESFEARARRRFGTTGEWGQPPFAAFPESLRPDSAGGAGSPPAPGSPA